MSKHHHKGGLPWIFNPYEIAFSAYSDSGKTTLICKLIELFKDDYRLAYAKSDAHKFEMDKEGKDTADATAAGASAIVINNQESRARLEQAPSDEVWRSLDLLEYDFVFIEGYKNETRAPRILILNDKMLAELEERDLSNVIAFAGPGNSRPSETLSEKTSTIPYFQRDDLTGLKKLILDQFQTQKPTLKGLVLTGGFSRRMGQDKSAINYHDQSQARYAYDLLAKSCDEVYLSVRDDLQVLPDDCEGLPRLSDQIQDYGPASGIISALQKDRKAAWMVMGCDLPLVNEEAIQTLCNKRNPHKYASTFISTSDGMPEPLLSIYEPKSLSRFFQYLAMNRNCPRKILLNSPVELISQGDHNWLDNINTPEDFTRINNLLNKENQPS